MKRNERVLADEAYYALDNIKCEAAVERALQLLKDAPEDPESYLLMSEVAEENEHFDHALMWLNQGLEHHPQHPGLLLKKASILIDGFEEIDEAFAILRVIENTFKAKSIADLKRQLGTELLLDIYLLLTDCYRLKSDYHQALAHAAKAKEIAPFDENALLSLATAHFELGNYDSALAMIEPIDKRNEPSDFYWLKAQVMCAEGRFTKADEAFATAFKLDKSRYHRPIRLSESEFVAAFSQALLGLPREIRDFIQTTAVEINDAIPVDVVKESNGLLSPTACIAVKEVQTLGHNAKIISMFQKNIENLAAKKQEIKDLIASALLHEVGKLALNN